MYNQGFAVVVLQQFHLLLVLLCLFKFHLGCILLHCLAVLPYESSGISLEYLLNACNLGIIFLLGNFPCTGAEAFFYVYVQARLEFAAFYCLWRKCKLAGAELVEGVDQVQQMVGVLHRTVRAKVLGAVPDKFSGEEYSWEWLILYAYPRIAFAVLEQDIVFGLVLFYEVVFKQQRVLLALYNCVLHICYL